MRPLGDTQKSMIRSLDDHGSWYPGCGWIWDNRSGTIKLLESLVRRELVSRKHRANGGDIYTLTWQGKKAAEERK